MLLFRPLPLFFYYLISEEVKYLCCSSYLRRFLSLSLSHPTSERGEREREGKKAKAPPPTTRKAQCGHFSPFRLAPFFSRSFNLRAEKPQWLLLAFWYHLSPSPLRRCSPPPPRLEPRRSLSYLPLSAALRLQHRHYSASVAAGDVQRRPALHVPAPSSHYGAMIPVRTCQRSHVISARFNRAAGARHRLCSSDAWRLCASATQRAASTGFE